MLDQWHESAIVKLQRSAHALEMRVRRPVEELNLLFQISGPGRIPVSMEGMLAFVEKIEGVVSVFFQSADGSPFYNPVLYQGRPSFMDLMNPPGSPIICFNRCRITGISTPEYIPDPTGRTVNLAVSIYGSEGETMGSLSIGMKFDYLLQDIMSQGWWQSDMACIVNEKGHYMAHTNMTMKGRHILGETGDFLETAISERMKTQSFGTLRSEGHPPDRIAGFHKLDHVPWTIILFADGQKILAPIVTYRNGLALGSLTLVILVILLIRFNIGRMVDQIRSLSERAGQVARGDYGRPIPVTRQDEIGLLVESFNAMVRGLEERDYIRNCFGRYVDPEIAKILMARPDAGQLGGIRREAVMIMSDIRGFTSLSETMSPERIVKVLNRYFSHMIEVIQQHQGIIIDFYGDAIFVFFDPLDGSVPDTIERAVRCAAQMQERMGRVNKELENQGLPVISMGIGIHAGPVIVGNIGSWARAKYGVVGSAVNITNRIQAHAEGGQVLVSDAVLSRTKDRVKVLKSFQADFKGVEQPMTLYVIHG